GRCARAPGPVRARRRERSPPVRWPHGGARPPAGGTCRSGRSRGHQSSGQATPGPSCHEGEIRRPVPGDGRSMATDGLFLAGARLIPRMVGDGPGAAAGRGSGSGVAPGSTLDHRRDPHGTIRSVPADVADIGVTGMAVMGSNLARNLARNGFKVAIHNRSVGKTEHVIDSHGAEGEFYPSESMADFV